MQEHASWCRGAALGGKRAGRVLVGGRRAGPLGGRASCLRVARGARVASEAAGRRGLVARADCTGALHRRRCTGGLRSAGCAAVGRQLGRTLGCHRVYCRTAVPPQELVMFYNAMSGTLPACGWPQAGRAGVPPIACVRVCVCVCVCVCWLGWGGGGFVKGLALARLFRLQCPPHTHTHIAVHQPNARATPMQRGRAWRACTLCNCSATSWSVLLWDVWVGQ